MGADPGARRRGRRRRSGWRCAAASSSARGPSAPTSCAASSPPRPRTGSTSSGSTTRSTTSRTSRERGEAIVAAGQGVPRAASSTARATTGADRTRSSSRRGELPELGAARALLHDPTGSLEPHQAGELVARRQGGERACPSASTARARAAPRSRDSLEAARAGADLIACAVYPLALSLHRVAGESLAVGARRAGHRTPASTSTRLWEASDLVDEHIGDEPVTPLAPRIAVRAAEYDLPTGLVAALDTHLRAHAAGDRLLEVLDELQRIRREAGSPPLAAPIGQILASQALLHVLSARRYGTVVDEFRALVQGALRQRRPGRSTPTVARAVALLSDGRRRSRTTRRPREDVRARGGGARGERGGAAPARALRRGGRGAAADDPRPRTPRRAARRARSSRRASERIRELVRIVQESGVAEVEIEDEGMRVSVRRTDERPARSSGAAPLAEDEPGELPVLPAARERARSASSRRWSASSTAQSEPGDAAVRRGRRRRHGRADALPARGDEALQRAEGGRRRPRRARSTPRTASRSSSGSSCSSSSRSSAPLDAL